MTGNGLLLNDSLFQVLKCDEEGMIATIRGIFQVGSHQQHPNFDEWK